MAAAIRVFERSIRGLPQVEVHASVLVSTNPRIVWAQQEETQPGNLDYDPHAVQVKSVT